MSEIALSSKLGSPDGLTVARRGQTSNIAELGLVAANQVSFKLENNTRKLHQVKTIDFDTNPFFRNNVHANFDAERKQIENSNGHLLRRQSSSSLTNVSNQLKQNSVSRPSFKNKLVPKSRPSTVSFSRKLTKN